MKIEFYGASHAPCAGIRVSGIPAGESVDVAALRAFLARRAPGNSPLTSARRETDEPVFVSGVDELVTNGDVLDIMIANVDRRSSDYVNLVDVPRPGHADYAVWLKTNGCEDMRGGGRFSARMTAPLCAAGGIALQILSRRGVQIGAHIAAVGGTEDEPFDPMGEGDELFERLRRSDIPVKSCAAGERMKNAILAAARDGDSVGGTVECMVRGVPAGLGDALLGGIESRMAPLLFAIPAVKGVEFGAGFGASGLRGSENNDEYYIGNGAAVPKTNNAGGILGGISTGLPIVFRVAFKPTPSIQKPQHSVNMRTMEETVLSVSGRHDPCVAVRAVPVVEAAAALAMLDIMERIYDRRT